MRGDCATEHNTRQDGAMCWLGRQSILKSVTEDAERRDLFGEKAERYRPCRDTRRTRTAESAFMLQRRPTAESGVGFRPPSAVRRPSWGHHTWDSAKDRARLPWKQGVVQLAILGLNPTTENKAAEAFCAAGWPESRNSGCARSLVEGCAAGSDTETRRPIEAAASVCCGQRNHASER